MYGYTTHHFVIYSFRGNSVMQGIPKRGIWDSLYTTPLDKFQAYRLHLSVRVKWLMTTASAYQHLPEILRYNLYCEPVLIINWNAANVLPNSVNMVEFRCPSFEAMLREWAESVLPNKAYCVSDINIVKPDLESPIVTIRVTDKHYLYPYSFQLKPPVTRDTPDLLKEIFKCIAEMTLLQKDSHLESINTDLSKRFSLMSETTKFIDFYLRNVSFVVRISWLGPLFIIIDFISIQCPNPNSDDFNRFIQEAFGVSKDHIQITEDEDGDRVRVIINDPSMPETYDLMSDFGSATQTCGKYKFLICLYYALSLLHTDKVNVRTFLDPHIRILETLASFA